jgi:hypothetical protein
MAGSSPNSVGDLIAANDYNTIQSLINGIMGTGTGGYGTTPTGQPVPNLPTGKTNNNTIYASQWNQLQRDLYALYFHQVSSSGQDPLLTVATTTGSITARDRNAYLQLAQQLSSTSPTTGGTYNGFSPSVNRPATPGCHVIAPSGQYGTVTITGASTDNPAVVASRTAAWGGKTNSTAPVVTESNIPTVQHLLSLQFTSALAAKYFFNAGGSVTFAARFAGTGASTTKNASWATLLSTMGTITFSYYGASGFNSGGQNTTGNGTSNGWSQLLANPGTAYRLYSIGYTSSGSTGPYLYAPNQYDIYGTLDASTQTTLSFTISFRDLSSNVPVATGSVTGTIAPSTVTLSTTSGITVGTEIFFSGATNGLPAAPAAGETGFINTSGTGAAQSGYFVASVVGNAVTLSTTFDNAMAGVVVTGLTSGSSSVTFQAGGSEDYQKGNTNVWDIDEDVIGQLDSVVKLQYPTSSSVTLAGNSLSPFATISTTSYVGNFIAVTPTGITSTGP